ncbi:MAG TPA: FMN-binding negative transcriptional regulator [Marmoricola sp.]
MWTPPFNKMPEDELRPMVADVGSAELITVGTDGFPIATRLPVVWRGDELRFHMAVANPQWRELKDGSPALAVVTGPEAYITPSWYAGKRTHGREVPTWNYTAIQFRGRVRVFRDIDGLRETVSELTDAQERRRDEPWAVSDAPDTFVDQQLRAIVGVDMRIEAITARAKRSQNRTLEDRRTVVEGLREGTAMEQVMAAQMAADLASEPSAEPTQD